MGRYRSDSEGESYNRGKKKKKSKKARKRSRSRSSSSGRSHRKVYRKSKSPGRRYSRSRSRSRSRSPYKYKYGSRPDSPRRRSKSPRRRSRSPRGRSRSPRGWSRGRSWSPGNRSGSPRRRSRSPRRRSVSPRSRSPRPRSRTPRRKSKSPRRRSRSPAGYRRSRSRSPKNQKKASSRDSSELRIEPGIPVPPAKQAQFKLQQALKAAALADERLKEAGLLPDGIGRSIDEIRADLKERQEFGVDHAAALEAIEDEGFSPAQFVSSRNTKPSSGTVLATHENAIFGSLPINLADMDPNTILKAGPMDAKTIMHPNLYVPAEEKMTRWRKKLVAMRKKKLEGEAM